MFYELMGRVHAAGERGQGTVEYVGLILLVGVLLAGVVSASGGFNDNSIATAVMNKLKDAIASVGGSAPADGAGAGH